MFHQCADFDKCDKAQCLLVKQVIAEAESLLHKAREGTMTKQRRVVTPQQLAEGYLTFVKDGIPNVIRHEYESPVKRSDGNYEVDEPTVALPR